MTRVPMPPAQVLDHLRRGTVVPAHPLALAGDRTLDERRQRALTRYYLAAGAGGIAVGVHTTQFAIHDPKVGLYRPVLELAAETIDHASRSGPPVIRIAGVIGETTQAVQEARTAAELGFHAGLVSLAALHDAPTARLIAHLRTIGEVIPIFGFYLQPAVGGRFLGIDLWRAATEIENLVAIKIAPFDRYQTLDVMRAVAESGRSGEIALYTGNDDHIVLDLLTRFGPSRGRPPVRIVGGLLGHWAIWTRRAVEQLRDCRAAMTDGGGAIPSSLLTLAAQVTDANAAVFDARNRFAGSIAGIHEVLRRQGLLAGRSCLDPDEDLSPGQLEEIDRVCTSYPHLTDDEFVAENLDDWLR